MQVRDNSSCHTRRSALIASLIAFATLIAFCACASACSSNESIVAPTHGVITDIVGNKITIYISSEDNHDIFAPRTGTITSIIAKEGDFDRYLKLFKAWEKKIGRLTIEINDTIFLLEVGEGYITKRVRLTKNIEQHVNQSEVIGEIVLGSLSEIYLPKAYVVTVQEGQRVIGGKTVLGIKKSMIEK